MDKQKPIEEKPTPDKEQPSLTAQDVVFAFRTSSGATAESRVHLEYSERIDAAAEARTVDGPILHAPPTPIGDDIDDADRSPPIDVSNERVSRTDTE